jgi:hypothetical protein
MDRDEMSNRYRGPPIDASYKVLVHLAKQFQRRRLKKIGQADLKNSSPLKLFGQMYRCLVGSIYGKSSVAIAYVVLIRLQTWLPQAIPCLLTDRDEKSNEGLP